MIYLVRHADAKSRSHWEEPDELRPLTKRGERQAKGLVGLLDLHAVRRVLTSPAVRCRETVRPLAEKVGAELSDVATLYEGHGGQPTMALIAELATKRGDSVLCTHGDVIPEVLRLLGKDGVRLRGEARWAKGSTWAVAVGDGRLTEARYLPPTE